MSKRMSVEAIAEVLIERISDIEGYAKRIEQASQKTLKVDATEVREVVLEMKKTADNTHRYAKSTGDDIRGLNKTLLAKFYLCFIFAFVVVAISCSLSAYLYFGVYSTEKKKYEEQRAEYEELYEFATKQRDELNALKGKKK